MNGSEAASLLQGQVAARPYDSPGKHKMVTEPTIG